jgi:hypothetical protein
MKRRCLAQSSLFVLLGWLAACGGPQFKRTPGAEVYAALAKDRAVAVVASDAELAPPVQDVGTLTLDDKVGDEAKAAEQLSQLARKKGCDALVGLRADVTEKRKVQTERKLDSRGQPAEESTEVVVKTWHWQARCVRSAAAELAAPATGAVVPAAEPTVETPPPAPLHPVVAAWQPRLAPLQDSWLRTWKGPLQAPGADAMTVVEALTDLAVQVTGPTGLWRQTLPTNWLGCPNQPDLPACKQIRAASGQFADLDALQSELARVRPGDAADFLSSRQAYLLQWMADWVPAEGSLSGLSATPAGKKHFPALQP